MVMKELIEVNGRFNSGCLTNTWSELRDINDAYSDDWTRVLLPHIEWLAGRASAAERKGKEILKKSVSFICALLPQA